MNQIYPSEKQNGSQFAKKIKLIKNIPCDIPPGLSQSKDLTLERVSRQSSFAGLIDADNSSFITKDPNKNSHIDFSGLNKVLDREPFTPIRMNSRNPTPVIISEGSQNEENLDSSTRIIKSKPNNKSGNILNAQLKREMNLRKPHEEELLFDNIENSPVPRENSSSEFKPAKLNLDLPGCNLKRNRFAAQNLSFFSEPETPVEDDLNLIKTEERRSSVVETLKDFVQVEPLNQFFNSNIQKTSLFAPNKKPQYKLDRTGVEVNQDEP